MRKQTAMPISSTQGFSAVLDPMRVLEIIPQPLSVRTRQFDRVSLGVAGAHDKAHLMLHEKVMSLSVTDKSCLRRS